MADTIEITLKEYTDIKDEWIFWKGRYPFLDMAYSKGKNPLVCQIHFELDPATANTPTETTDPTNIIFNYTSAVNVELVSSNAGDTNKTIYVIGDHSSTGFGLYTFTSDGTTGVDIGDWYSILYTWTTETLAGTMKLWDGSANDYFTYVSGTDKQTKGIVVIPKNYYGAILDGHAQFQEIPAAGDATLIEIEDDWNGFLNLYHPEGDAPSWKKPYSEETRIECKFAYIANAIDTQVDLTLILWEA